MKRIYIWIVSLFLSASIYAQQTLTLEECRQLAIQNNKELKISGEKQKIAQQWEL